MRIVYVNLHMDRFFVRDLICIVKRQRAFEKLRYQLDYMLNNGVEVLNLVTPHGSELPRIVRNHLKPYLCSVWEAKYVLKKNGFSTEKIKLITSPDEIREDDIVMFYSSAMLHSLQGVERLPGIKIVDHYHFYGESDVADLLKDKDIRYYMYDVDLKKYSKIYQKNYAWFDGKYIMRPFTYQPRFCVKTPFSQRKTKATAMGTVTKRPTAEFIAINGTDCYQPRRRMVMENAKSYPDEIDSYISDYEEKPLKVIHDKDLPPVKFYKKVSNFLQSGRQKNYFSFDMVEKYNEYKMFICPEDIHGSYGVGMVEGMACGCALIGADYGGYEDIGLVAGESYIAYDGTMEDLVKKIRYYQKPEKQAELEQIAKTGCEYIRKNFSQEVAAKQYYETMKALAEKHPAQEEG